MLEFGEYLEHFLLDDLDVLVEELFDGVGAKIKEHGELFEDGGVGGLVDVDDIGEHLCQTAVDIVVEFPLDLAQEIPVNYELVGIYQQLFADASEEALEGIFEVVVLAERFFHECPDQLLHLVELRLQVVGVELGIARGVDLQGEVFRSDAAFIGV